MKIIIYKLDSLDLILNGQDIIDSGYRTVFWKPSLKSFVPPDKDKKYLLYWFFHQLGIFRNGDYGSLLVYDGQQMVSSLLIVPSYYKWPFMSKNDLQFTYVMTRQDYRGKGIAAMAMRYAINQLKNKERNFWYVTDEKNTVSIKLCSGIGFKFYSYARRFSILKILKTTN
jgi:GNAT superfamily N-acetyltransferase